MKKLLLSHACLSDFKQLAKFQKRLKLKEGDGPYTQLIIRGVTLH
jgi:hypothetical protein